MKQEVAILITCHNRKDKTIACLSSLYSSIIEQDKYLFDLYLVDDGSTDGTDNAIRTNFPKVKIIYGNGNLFWAGGMRLAWNTAIKSKKYDAYLLINDDVILKKDFISNIIATEEFSIISTGKKGIYTGATKDDKSDKITYGGKIITSNHFIVKTQIVIPSNKPEYCELSNANILWISKDVVNCIGIFDNKFTHGIADYDYTRTAHEHKFPIWVVPNICGICSDDHGNNWKPSNTMLKERIKYLKNPKGLAYYEYLYYIKKHFPLYYPYSLIMLWLKTLCPFVWDRLKKH